MTTIPPSIPPVRTAERSYAKTETGGTIAFERTLESGQKVTGQTTITRNGDGTASVEVIRTGPQGRYAAAEKTFTAEELSTYGEKLSALAERLREGTAARAAEGTDGGTS